MLRQAREALFFEQSPAAVASVRQAINRGRASYRQATPATQLGGPFARIRLRGPRIS
jgi:hypothetical protein